MNLKRNSHRNSLPAVRTGGISQETILQEVGRNGVFAY
ncbi:hypothetical protein MmTuc01_1115 [Methanosarcina mazei Tuc01]|uniref:Uncharacterized protein n=1 Tax=Methanosarcina mazei Tuc01 TaxID=1236903 RepID=M1QHT0_METMZ|nr:hypothetical protein MmTuc01_1115 [Methanosarcina mazei Tuc01]